jgi:hypothetical protein
MGSADAALYTVPALTSAKIGRAVFSNTDSAAHSITVNITTGASSTANQIINARSLAPGETYVSPELAGAVLPALSQLRGLASQANFIVVTISGLLVVGS